MDFFENMLEYYCCVKGIESMHRDFMSEWWYS